MTNRTTKPNRPRAQAFEIPDDAEAVFYKPVKLDSGLWSIMEFTHDGFVTAINTKRVQTEDEAADGAWMMNGFPSYVFWNGRAWEEAWNRDPRLATLRHPRGKRNQARMN